MSFLLDTNVLSEAQKRDGDRNVRAWLDSVSAVDLYISVLVVGEIRQGIERLRRRDVRQAEVYEAWLAVLRRVYRDRVIPITTEVAEEWGRLNVPNPIAGIDGLMAATAKVHDLTLVTRNIADISRAGVRVVNPFEPANQPGL
jgi:predicted nucleic acid-binding protein